MTTQSNTPRTDARMEYDASDLDCTINFARELERELNAALARAEKAEAERAANFQSLEICAMHCDEARAMVKRVVTKM